MNLILIDNVLDPANDVCRKGNFFFRLVLIIGDFLDPASDVGGLFSPFRLVLIYHRAIFWAQQTMSEGYFHISELVLYRAA